MNFTIIDWLILSFYLAFSVFIGVRAKRYVEDLEAYFVAGRRVKVALGSATLIATEIGIVTFMYLGQIGYLTGFSCFVLGIIGAFAFFVIGKTGFVVSKLRKLKVITIPEFYEMRYSKGVRLFGGMILFLGGVLNMGVFLKFDGLFLAEVMGFGLERDVLFLIMTIMLLIVITYTVLGGMFSVVITDFMQFVILSFGMFITTFFILKNVNLFDVANAVVKYYGEEGINPVLNPRFGWKFLLWMLIASVTTSGLWQPVTSKSLSSEDEIVGRKIFTYTGLTLAGRYMIPMFWGVCALAAFGPNVDSQIAMPRLIAKVVPNGFLGLLVAGMLAASMSTYSAYLLAWSSVATRDIIQPIFRGKLDENSSIMLTRIIAVLIGLYLLIFGLFYEIPTTAFQYIAVTGAMYTSGAFGCVAGGLYWKKANSTGAYIALILGAIGPLAFLVLSLFKDFVPKSMHFLLDVNLSGFISFILAGIGMVAGSFFTNKVNPPKNIEFEK
ncbi:sodium:solute symporter family protein [Candidatus Kryptobacter tengchongensis]|uniref:Solute:Na+ symporter, SSS family n=1 Tax=Kryptobacter tengchongensis TaxID=1643429 RepID=A0A916PE30_KRYT1|nr:sodium:solute symporter family protein [Candidatus Kryptobacter tengchongensis]CUS96980.1 solute:Na+ symporter, SSS family [Candidatus Kryptobacter tengchongensis]